MKEQLQEIKERCISEIKTVNDLNSLNLLKAKHLGRKGTITELLKGMKDVPEDQRPLMGRYINEVKDDLERQIEEKKHELIELDKLKKLEERKIDVTLPARGTAIGSLHPVTQVMDEIVRIFSRMGFEVAEGPEIETDFYNFEALNIPKDHPARDMQDTFYISDDLVLRTHTSPVQVRVMETHQPPVQIIAPGKVYRCDSDISHTPMFHQVEGLLVNETVSFADLKGVLIEFCRIIFGEKTRVRFRPSFFPFTEPSAEVDIGCVICKARGCRVCKDTGWLEILGCGMVDPEVFKSVNYDYNKYRGFAFGMGVERIAMLKYGINDIRLFFENDIRFLKQF